ncbi:MAG TPA: hypothetical protein PK581_04240 [Caldisericia bacterium]|nr:hypothetical protein [Caldisericia bacterium]
MKAITCLLMILFVLSVLMVQFISYQPLRYLKKAHADEIVLPKNPFKAPKLFIIEAPTLKLENYEKVLHPDLPPLYINLPTNTSKEVLEFLEKRNSYIHQLNDNNSISHFSSKSPGDNTFKITEVIPIQHDGQDGFIGTSDKAINNGSTIYFDSELNYFEIENGKTFRTIISVKFPDRSWFLSANIGGSGASFFYKKITYGGSFNTTYLYVSQDENFSIDPFKTMKIIHPNTNPEMVVHIESPKELNPFMNVVSIVFLYTGVLSLLLLLSIFLSRLIIWILKKCKNK